MEKIDICMLSHAARVDGQGVGSAYLEQTALIKESTTDFTCSVNKIGKHDIYHVHSVNPDFYFRMTKKRTTVCYVHFLPSTLDGSIKLPKLSFTIFKRYVVKFYKKAKEIVVVNPIFIDPLVELGMKRENITYIPNYVSKESFFIEEKSKIDITKEKYNIDKDSFVVLGVGQIQTRKGVLDFCEVAKQNPDKTFVWAGGFSFGNITDGYHELKKIYDNPPKNVLFIGMISRKEMNSIYNMSDLLFMPSFNELFPMAILEAVNCNKPVLLRDLELYEDILFGKYLKASDNDGFSYIINKLSTDNILIDESKRNSKFIADYYSKENVRQLWINYYRRINNKYC